MTNVRNITKSAIIKQMRKQFHDLVESDDTDPRFFTMYCEFYDRIRNEFNSKLLNTIINEEPFN